MTQGIPPKQGEKACVLLRNDDADACAKSSGEWGENEGQENEGQKKSPPQEATHQKATTTTDTETSLHPPQNANHNPQTPELPPLPTTEPATAEQPQGCETATAENKTPYHATQNHAAKHEQQRQCFYSQKTHLFN